MTAFSTIRRTVLAAACTLLAAQAGAAELPPRPSVADVVKASAPSDWRVPAPDNTLYMDVPGGRVVIELAPVFAPNHVKNIKALVRERYFDGLAILRVQDNYVVQWGDPDEDNDKARAVKGAKKTLKAEFTVPLKNDTHFTRLPDVDGYAPQVGHSDGFPAGRDPKTGETWLAHCYGMVGVGRDNDADSGGGTALYAVLGPARQLDRNITVVGRVIAGMPLLSALPRGPAPMGFYDKPEMNVPIQAVRVAADVPAAERSRYEIMRTDSATYQKCWMPSATAAARGPRSRRATWTCAPRRFRCANNPNPIRGQSTFSGKSLPANIDAASPAPNSGSEHIFGQKPVGKY